MTLSKEVMKPRIHGPFHLLFMARIISWLVISHASALKYTYTRFVIFKLFDVKLLKKNSVFVALSVFIICESQGCCLELNSLLYVLKELFDILTNMIAFLLRVITNAAFISYFFNMWLQVSAHGQLSLVKKASAS